MYNVKEATFKNEARIFAFPTNLHDVIIYFINFITQNTQRE